MTKTKVNIKYTNLEPTPAIEEYLNKKLAKIGKFAEREQDEVILRVEVGKTTRHHQSGEIFRAEIQTRITGQDVRAVTERDDLYAAIDEAKEEILRELKNTKSKRDTTLRKSGRRVKHMLKRLYR